MFTRLHQALSAALALLPHATRRAVRLTARQPSLLFGVFGIVILWVGVLCSLSVERQAAIDKAVRDTGNFALAFQEQITGTFAPSIRPCCMFAPPTSACRTSSTSPCGQSMASS
jgi:hypothetical protein